MPFEFIPLDIPDVILVRPKVFGDSRGFFMETYKHSDFAEAGIREHFVQDNFSRSGRNVLRGLHYQKNPAAQGKLIKCISGKILDVAVDIRKCSPFYGKWVSSVLSDDDGSMFYVPPGFAHGFLVLSDLADILYKCTAEYSPENDRGIIWSDPDLGIEWPVREPVVSQRDGLHPLLRNADNNFRIGKLEE